MVVTLFPATLEICVTQERVGWPLTWTVQAPQSAMPQPNLVPVIPSVSRSTQRSGICGGTSTDWDFPFRVNVTAIKASRDLWVTKRVYRETGARGYGAIDGYPAGPSRHRLQAVRSRVRSVPS